MQQHKRYTSRSEIQEETLTEERKSELHDAYTRMEFGERIQQTTATVFTVAGDLPDNTAVLSTSLDRDNVFPLISSYMDGSGDGERKASATVRDVETDAEIRADVINGRILISPRSDNVPYQTFRDYCLFIESKLGVTLSLA